MSTMRRILVDNATLSGVERLTGISKTLNLNYIDNDILCLEKLVTAILFSDQLIGIDDYKNEFRSSRLKNFSFIEFIKLDDSSYRQLAEESAAFARSMTISVEKSKLVGDIEQFFQSLRIDAQLRWDVWVSSEYLTFSYLVSDPKAPDYELSIDSVFRNKLTDSDAVKTERTFTPKLQVPSRPQVSEVKELVQALVSNNPRYAGTDGKSALQRIIFGYGWAAERSHFYNAVANLQDADVFLAPLRDSFCESCVRLDYPSQAHHLLEMLKKKSQETLFSILEPSGGAKFSLRLPFFAAYLLSRTENPKQSIELALTMRNEKDFRECRTIFHNLDHLRPGERVQEINRILKYLDESCANLMKKYAVTTANGLQFSMSLGITGISFGVDMKLGQLLRHHKNRSFSRVFRNIAQDMINVERLGNLRTKACSLIEKHKDATYPKIATTPKFMESKENEYGRPAELEG